mmetsp:Transcript_5370/g.9903  ORF Transcript_5370/g.9903 Transcript_5370/m.9903 type:complete len:153 (-) Transcript_5370:1416-1874(-)
MSTPAEPSDSVAWAKAEAIDENSGHPIPTAPLDEESLVTASEITDAPSHGDAGPATPLIATTTTTTIQHVVAPLTGLGRYPCVIHCPFCHQETMTRTKDTMGCTAVVAVVLLCFICWPFAWIPCCIPTCKATDHYCRQCRRRIGRVEPCSSD